MESEEKNKKLSIEETKAKEAKRTAFFFSFMQKAFFANSIKETYINARKKLAGRLSGEILSKDGKRYDKEQAAGDIKKLDGAYKYFLTPVFAVIKELSRRLKKEIFVLRKENQELRKEIDELKQAVANLKSDLEEKEKEQETAALNSEQDNAVQSINAKEAEENSDKDKETINDGKDSSLEETAEKEKSQHENIELKSEKEESDSEKAAEKNSSMPKDNESKNTEVQPEHHENIIPAHKENVAAEEKLTLVKPAPPSINLKPSTAEKPVPPPPAQPKKIPVKEHKYSKDDIVEIGIYPYEEDGKMRPIEWLVLETYKDGTALLLSKYGLDSKPYNTDYVDVEWAKCTLREWLNRSFFNTAFSAREQTGIVVSDNENQAYDNGNAVLAERSKDKIFLLSHEEAERYFKGDGARRAKPTPYAVQRGAYINGNAGWWWLRTQGFNQHTAAAVSLEGAISTQGRRVNSDSETVRAAMRFNLNLIK